MAVVHPDIQALLNAVLETDLATLAEDALARIHADEEEPEFLSEVSRSFGGRVAYRQLDAAESAIVTPLKRELDMMTALREIRPKFGLKKILVAPPQGEGRPDLERTDDLTSMARSEAIHTFLKTWNKHAEYLRTKWQIEDGDDYR